MSIKQLGGVFGRNPTFNDVTIEGELTFDGDIDVNSDLKVDGDLVVTGKIGVGTDTPSDEMEIRSTSPKINFTDSSDDTSGSVGYNVRALMMAADGTHRFYIGGDEKVRILETSGDVSLLGGGNLVVNSGNGIDFSATAGTGTSELFSDYEEGTWTPNYTAATGGDLGGTQNRQGYYTKVGNKVTVQFYLYINTIDVTGKSGDVTVTGLPFTGSLGGNATGSLVVTEDTGQYGAFTNSPRTMKLSGSGDSLVLLKEISSNVEQPLQVTDFATGGGNRNIIRASFTYIV